MCAFRQRRIIGIQRCGHLRFWIARVANAHDLDQESGMADMSTLATEAEVITLVSPCTANLEEANKEMLGAKLSLTKVAHCLPFLAVIELVLNLECTSCNEYPSASHTSWSLSE